MDEAGGGSAWGRIFSSDFLPHATCYQQRPEIIWLNVASDATIAFAYYGIPLILVWFVSKRRDVPFNWMFVMFAAFILACGTTHVLEIVTVWKPIYGVAGLVKALTGLVSVAAMLGLIPIMPKALALPSLRAANAQLAMTADELRRTNRELEQFAYVAAHDLQEPLRMVAMYMDLLGRRQGGNLDEQAREWIGSARSGADRMRALIHGLLDYTRLDAQPAGDGVADAAQSLSEALEVLRPQIVATGTDVTIGALPRVRCDQRQLTQVLQNLVGNAIKYGTTGKPWVHVSAQRDGDDVVIQVQDNGIGIEPSQHQRIFEVFQRLHRRDEYPGTGIGLSICKKIVERHGGRIWVESQPGIGSIFRFALRAA